MPTITILTGHDTIHAEAPEGALLSSVLQAELPTFALPCAGNHTCGKCRVQVSGAALPPAQPPGPDGVLTLADQVADLPVHDHAANKCNSHLSQLSLRSVFLHYTQARAA